MKAPERSRGISRTRSSKRRGSSSAAEVANSQDLLIEILLRLPAKPLHKFKSVSKQWYSIISAPKFSVTYAKTNPNPHLGLLLNAQLSSLKPNIFVSLGGYQYGSKHPCFLKIPKFQIHHVCNGLLCYSKPHVNAPQLSSYYVCNHVSGQSKRIRVLESPCIQKLRAVNLAFDPLKSHHYKLIFVSEVSGSVSYHLVKIDIYSSETDSWRAAKKGFYIVHYDIGFDNGVYWNDAVYWYHEKKKSLAYFDFNDDSLESLAMPPASVPMTYYCFGASGGHLHLVGTWMPWTSMFTVFELEKDRSGWTVMYDGEFDALSTMFPEMVTNELNRNCSFSVLNLYRGEREGELILVLAIPGGLVQYNVQDKTAKKLLNLLLTKHKFQNKQFKAHPYIETLASI